MRFASYEAYEIHPLKIFSFAAFVSLAVASATWVGLQGILGGSTPEVSIALAAAAGYLIVTSPRRLLSADRFAQSREALALSVSATACMEVTRSKSRTLLILKGRNRSVSSALEEIKKYVLLGKNPGDAVRETSRWLASRSAVEAVEDAASTGTGPPETGGEEHQGYERAFEAEKETSLPILMTVCFFAPIMLVLYSVFARVFDPWGLAELVGLGFLATDLAFFFCSGRRDPR